MYVSSRLRYSTPIEQFTTHTWDNNNNNNWNNSAEESAKQTAQRNKLETKDTHTHGILEHFFLNPSELFRRLCFYDFPEIIVICKSTFCFIAGKKCNWYILQEVRAIVCVCVELYPICLYLCWHFFPVLGKKSRLIHIESTRKPRHGNENTQTFTVTKFSAFFFILSFRI